MCATHYTGVNFFCGANTPWKHLLYTQNTIPQEPYDLGILDRAIRISNMWDTGYHRYIVLRSTRYVLHRSMCVWRILLRVCTDSLEPNDLTYDDHVMVGVAVIFCCICGPNVLRTLQYVFYPIYR